MAQYRQAAGRVARYGVEQPFPRKDWVPQGTPRFAAAQRDGAAAGTAVDLDARSRFSEHAS